ncbi:hypothetical protein ACU635_14115 [[Actinomadura] parvosata]|uniref:hypothetical protein n=1 Tax=[Actinomadura] parvosata TaxID=1955412 RepID=UPI00406C93EF
MTVADNLPAIASWSVPDRLKYAHELANAGLLPDSFRKQPANVLYAIEYGIALRVDPVVAITEIHVIKGKPCPSSAFMSALVRRAGHKLRIKVERDDNGNPVKAVATLIRADDPDFEFVSEWSVARAQRAGLFKQNDNYAKYTEQMLKARAQGEVCRDGAKEALLGLSYLPEEMGAVMNEDGSYVVTDATVQAGASVREAAAAAQEATGVVMANAKKLKDLADLMDAKGVQDKLGYIRELFPDHEFKSAHDLTAAQADQVANAINRGVNLPAQQDADEAQTASENPPQTPAADEPVEGDVIDDPNTDAPTGQDDQAAARTPLPRAKATELNTWFTEAGIGKDDRFPWLAEHVGVTVNSTSDLSAEEASKAITILVQMAGQRRKELWDKLREVWTDMGGTHQTLTEVFTTRMSTGKKRTTLKDASNSNFATFLKLISDGKITQEEAQPQEESDF